MIKKRNQGKPDSLSNETWKIKIQGMETYRTLREEDLCTSSSNHAKQVQKYQQKKDYKYGLNKRKSDKSDYIHHYITTRRRPT